MILARPTRSQLHILSVLMMCSVWLFPSTTLAHTRVERAHPSDGARISTLLSTPVHIPSADRSASLRIIRKAPLTLIRWTGLLVTFLLVGALIFKEAVLRHAVVTLEAGDARSLDDKASWRLRHLTMNACVALLLMLPVEVAIGAAEHFHLPLWRAVTTDTLLRYHLETQMGWSVLIRGGLPLLLVIPAFSSRKLLRVGARTGLLWVPPIVGALLLSGYTVTAHVARLGPLAAFADWAHLLSSSAWIGGLAALLTVLRGIPHTDRSHVTRALVSRFSSLAGISLVGVVLTGLYLTLLQLPALGAFPATPNEQAFLVKVFLFTALVGLGAINRYVLVPRLATVAWYGSLRRLRRAVMSEIALGAIILAVVALRVIVFPAKTADPVTIRLPSHQVTLR